MTKYVHLSLYNTKKHRKEGIPRIVYETDILILKFQKVQVQL